MVLTADDVNIASQWYAELLNITPYFRNPETGPRTYTEFRIGPDEDELEILNRAFVPTTSAPATIPITYWHTDDIHSTLTELISRGAIPHNPIIEREGGFTTASVTDPFGNTIGVMYSPHWRARH